MKRTFQLPPFSRVLPNLFAFVFGLGAAWFLKWETTDLVWSLWLSSLVIGYLTILLTVAAAIIIGIMVMRHDDFPRDKRVPVIVGGSAFALFTLAFFSFHFCGFHAGHATFLAGFFPVAGVPEHAFFDSFVNPFKLWSIAIGEFFPRYGVFLIAAGIVERRNLAAPFIDNWKEGRAPEGVNVIKKMLKTGHSEHKSFNNPMVRPYINVIRMHILIFFFAAAHALKLDSFLVYAVVYAVYFFPWSDFFVETNSVDA